MDVDMSNTRYIDFAVFYRFNMTPNEYRHERRPRAGRGEVFTLSAPRVGFPGPTRGSAGKKTLDKVAQPAT